MRKGIKSREVNLALANRSGNNKVFMELQPQGSQCGDHQNSSALKYLAFLARVSRQASI